MNTTMTPIEQAIKLRLMRSAKHHCYTQGKTRQYADLSGAWICSHCEHVVEPLTDSNVHGWLTMKQCQ